MMYVICWIFTGIVSVLIGNLIDIIRNKEIPETRIEDIYMTVLLYLLGPITAIVLIVSILTDIKDIVIFKGKKWS